MSLPRVRELSPSGRAFKSERSAPRTNETHATEQLRMKGSETVRHEEDKKKKRGDWCKDQTD